MLSANLQREAIATEVVFALGCAIPEESCHCGATGAPSRACRPAESSPMHDPSFGPSSEISSNDRRNALFVV